MCVLRCFTCLGDDVRPPAPDVKDCLSTQQRSLHWSGRRQEGFAAEKLTVFVASPKEQITIF